MDTSGHTSLCEDYVSFETAKLLKEKGFTEWCFKCYGVAVLHNGADISFDEECDLKDEGRENEIEYVEGGRLYDYACNNREKVRAVWAAPTLWVAMKWLREVHNIDIIINVSSKDESYNKREYTYVIVSKWFTGTDNIKRIYEEACEAGIRYCLENLI